MIRSRWRRAGHLAPHLERTDTNEINRVREDLCRNCPSDATTALRLFTAISRTNPRCARDLIHIRVAPGKADLDEDGIVRVLGHVEAEHRIPPTVPRYVREHLRGVRPRHLHLIYPVVDPDTGRAIRSADNYLADEIASRLCEIELGEPIVPGPRQGLVVKMLRRRGQAEAANLLASYAPARLGDRIDDATHQQAANIGVDVGAMKSAVDAAWTACAGDMGLFVSLLEKADLSLCQGRNVILVFHDATGGHLPLGRTLRQIAKERGNVDRIREVTLRSAFGQLPDLDAARSRALTRSEDAASTAVQNELRRMAEEASLDGQTRLAERLRRVRDNMAARRRKAFKATLAERKRRIAADYARRDRLRRARVLRAARMARLLDRKDVRQMMFGIAATSVVLAGGGLGLALVAAGVAVAAMPSWERARAIWMQADLDRRSDHDARARATRAAVDEVAAECRVVRHLHVRFADIPKRRRALTGFYAHLLLDEAEGRLRPQDKVVVAAAARVLGAVAPTIKTTLFEGGRSGLIILGWYDPTDQRHRAAARAALAMAGESAASAHLRHRQTPQGGRER